MVITNNDGQTVTGAGAFTYVVIPVPAVTAVSPAGGSTAGGTRVTLTGTAFTGATAVRFGTTAGTDLVVEGDTQITVSSPAHTAGIVGVTVTTPGGTSVAVAADQFTYSAPPAVTAVSPVRRTSSRRHPGHAHRYRVYRSNRCPVRNHSRYRYQCRERHADHRYLTGGNRHRGYHGYDT